MAYAWCRHGIVMVGHDAVMGYHGIAMAGHEPKQSHGGLWRSSWYAMADPWLVKDMFMTYDEGSWQCHGPPWVCHDKPMGVHGNAMDIHGMP